jgi:anti-anti-sigma regulatory factor
VTAIVRAIARTRRDVEDGGAQEREGVRDLRVEVSHDDVDGLVVSLEGVLGCRDVAVLSRHLHTALDASPITIVVDLSRLRSVDDSVRQVLGVARERAAASGTGLRLIEFDHQIGRDR